jgi:hypothetical protein
MTLSALHIYLLYTAVLSIDWLSGLLHEVGSRA